MKEERTDLEDLNTTIGARVRMLRKSVGWSLDDLADRSEISKSYLAELERGEKRWNVGHISLVADAFGVPPSLLSNPKIPLENIEAMGAILSALSPLPLEKLQVVLQLLQAFHP